MAFDSDPGYVPGTTNYGIFFLMKQGEPESWLRLWSGGFDIDIPAGTVDTEGGAYKGLDFPLAIPELEGCLNGQTSSGEFILSGVSEAANDLLSEDSDEVIGSRIFMGVQDFAPGWGPMGSVSWIFRAYAGRPKSAGRGGANNFTFSMSLPWQSEFYDRNQAALAYYSPVSQRRRRADDAYCDEVPKMAAGQVLTWMIF
jgi:hypothetical protein